MRSSTRRFLTLLLATCLPAQAPLDFAEQFALATDRGKVLEQLIPGSEDWYFWHCLHAQNQGELGKVKPWLEAWIARHGRDARVEEIENRQALLGFEKDQAATWTFLRERLGLRFEAERRSAGAKPDLPTRLDPELLSLARLSERALALHPGSLDGFRERGLRSLAPTALDADRLRALLQRLDHPDVPNLPALVARDLQNPKSSGFGSLGIHKELLLDQLEELVRLLPRILDETAFVDVYLRRLAPSADVRVATDAAAREAYLDRLLAFCQRLSAAHNSLKAHVLYRRLTHDLAKGAPDKQRFLSYLRLPRQTGYGNPEYLRRVVRGGELVDASQAYPTGLAAIGDDETLVRAYLQHFFATEDSYEPYTELVQEAWLKRLFAETKILAGAGDMERWYSLLADPAYYEALKRRVEIAFPPTQRRHFAGGEAVGIDVDVKNVDKLLVKVFVIDTFAWERDHAREVDASLDLDGLIANEEQSYTYPDNPLRRVRRHFDFPSLQRPGTYVVELLGNGIASRAVIKKGRLAFVARIGSAGQVLTVLDESGQVARGASVWCGGQQYDADQSGEVNLPFAPASGQQPLILRQGQLTSLERFARLDERYALSAGAFVDREALAAGQKAKLLVRPVLTVQGVPIDLALLEQPELRITAIDQDGVETATVARDLKLVSSAELVHEIAVPDRLVALTVALRGRVKSLSMQKHVELASAPVKLAINAIEKTPLTEYPLLGRDASGYWIEVRGKSGEPRPDRVVTLQLFHRGFKDPVEVALKTDRDGRIELGALAEVEMAAVTGTSGGLVVPEACWWFLDDVRRTRRAQVTGVAGKDLRIAYNGAATGAGRAAVALLETRGWVWVRDVSASVSLEAGFVVLRGLDPGDYTLLLPEERSRWWPPGIAESLPSVSVRVTAGAERAGWAVGKDRMLPLAGRDPLQVTAVAIEGKELVVRLANADAATRVHVFATRYVAAFAPSDLLAAPLVPLPADEMLEWPESSYRAGREIGDEYRYILDRRYAQKLPGNMLHRPGLLLNPWSFKDHDSEGRDLRLGEGLGGEGRFGGRQGEPMGQAIGGMGELPAPPGRFANTDFLPPAAPMLCNLRPDAQGVVRVALDTLGQGQLVHVVACDATDTVVKELALPAKPLAPRSRALQKGLDPAQHFTEQRRIEFLAPGGKAVVDDVTTAKLESYDTLAKVFGLLRTLSGNAELDRFAFLLRWPQLGDEEKRKLYSEHACHELHLFLHEKDRAFFDRVVRPYLANKLHQTFLDRWLLDQDLAAYLEPWAFDRLNVAEQILLTKRLPGAAEAGARRVRELLDLVPPDPEREGKLFAAVLGGQALEGARGSLSTATAREPQREEAKEQANAPKPNVPEAFAAGEPEAAAKKLAAPAKDPSLHADKGDAQKPGESGKKERDGKDRFAEKARNSDEERRKQVREVWRAPDRTREYLESDYWHVIHAGPELVKVNAFWRDFAGERPGVPFCSPSIAEATSSLSEMLLALAVLDLPFTAEALATERDGNRLALQAKSPLLLVKKEIRPAAAGQAQGQVLIGQGIYRLDERYRFEGSQRLDNFVTGELLAGIAYGCQVVVTNPASTPRKLDLLLQIPRGAVPVQGGFVTRGVSVQLEPFATAAFEYAFYFPEPGDFPHYPAHVAKDGALVAFASPAVLHVVATPTTVDTGSWEHVSQDASTEALLAYLDGHSPWRLDLARIAWRMRDRAVFMAVVDRLQKRLCYSDVLWSYGLLHGDEASAREYLRHADAFVACCGKALASRLLVVDPLERQAWQHVEFDPLFHARAHRIGRERKILNQDLARQYGALLEILGYRPRLDDGDLLAATYYLLLQDRVDEAREALARIDAKRLPTNVQLDYLRCYLDFFTDAPKVARGIAERYRDYPVPRWQALFRDVLSQLDEVDGKPAVAARAEDLTQRQTELAASEPGLELGVEARKVTLRWQNLASCTLSYYQLDVEASFSGNPFVQQAKGAFAYVQPNRSDTVALPAGQKELVLDLPADLQRANVLVEVRGGPITRRQTYLASSLAVQTVESYGQLQVTQAQSGKPLPKTYVKVYARLPGNAVRFHKDGYTDLRGRFDYASVSEPGTGDAERYAILVVSEADGSLIREVAPPGK